MGGKVQGDVIDKRLKKVSFI